MGIAARGHTWRRRILLSICWLALLPFAAHAGDMTAALMNARVTYDDARWSATQSAGNAWLRFDPLGQLGKDLDPVDFRVVRSAAPCSALVRQIFEAGRYDTRSVATTPASIGGKPGERFAAHTGCRNATPRGVIICVKDAGQTYLLQALRAGCRGRNPFSGVDPLAEIADGIIIHDGTPLKPGAADVRSLPP